MVDMRKQVAGAPDTVVTTKDLERWVREFGPLPSSVAVIFNFGWAPKYANKTEYLGSNSSDDKHFHFPGVSKGE